MSQQVPETWLVGVVAHDDALSSVRVHAGYVAHGPSSGRDHRIHVRLRFGDTARPRFPDPEESTVLIAREDAIVAGLEDRAVLVAVLTVPGFRDLVFHTAVPEECRTRLAEVLTTEPGAGVGAGDGTADEPDVAPDPSWSLYRSLFADAVPADTDRRRIHAAAAATGESAPSCDVEHRFSFPTLAEADQAAAALRDVGLTVTFVAADDAAQSAPPRFVVADHETLTQIDMARSRDALSGFAVSWGGDYLGWEIADPR